ncbi:thioredoxin family protein [Ginsengibacter hankyongi]|uniref:Thioredoxin family protein n=1 Tax=Ginsengibacter hankyongi TaxID=2607284 RepID=A0A5J5IHC5_9BACT|nr:thioredoxin family protein [Ginsengibacter hankyongi]KAA9037142.1 thioredoxin family protein [Ginsengibacter hankyongi]
MQELMKNRTTKYFTESEVAKAFQIAKQKHIPVLTDFWAPNCKGCKKMEITTYEKTEIRSYLDDYFVFVKYDITNRNVPKIDCSPILWTPTFIVFSNDGSEVRKITGYLNDPQFEAKLEIGRAMASLRKAQPNTALEILESLIATTANKPSIPEALYWAGVASYFQNKRNAESLVPYWERLIQNYSESIWATKADCLNVKL